MRIFTKTLESESMWLQPGGVLNDHLSTKLTLKQPVVIVDSFRPTMGVFKQEITKITWKHKKLKNRQSWESVYRRRIGNHNYCLNLTSQKANGFSIIFAFTWPIVLPHYSIFETSFYSLSIWISHYLRNLASDIGRPEKQSQLP